MQTYSISEGRKTLGDIIAQVKYQNKIIGIGNRNKTEALIIPYNFTESSVNITEINANSSSFEFLNQEPDLYKLSDLKIKY